MLPPVSCARLAAAALLFLTACSGDTATPLADAPAAPHTAAAAGALPAYPGFRPIPEVTTPAPPYRPAPGTRVVDADTVDFEGARYRLHGIDAPESRQTCRTWGLTWSCGAAATQALATHPGALACSGTETDRYGRVIGVCSAGGIDLNAWLVASGWALAYRRYADDYVPQEEDARRQRLGIHSGDFIDPWDWRQGQRLPGKDTFAALASHPLDVRALADRLLHGHHAGVYGYWLHDSVFGVTDSQTAFSMGAFPATQPAGSGSAAYRGHVVAIDARTAETLRGDVTLVIPDLTDPALDLSITGIADPAGNPRPGHTWHDIPLSAGQFEAATATGRLIGRFYGTGHQEAGGLVATDTLTGAFGAYRD